ncbi:MAG TPA: XRE family transcriptional regulator [Streptosporangiaceae bacterium]|nr:XRE family transcriptional regulator [Streptosporangiaceae bacterium]
MEAGTKGTAVMADGKTGPAALGMNEAPLETAEPEEYAAQVGARVAAARKQSHMSGAELGAIIGLRKDQISKIESGRRRLDISELPRVASALGVTVRHLLGQAERPALAVAARLAAGAPSEALRPARRRARQLLEIEDLLTQVTEMPPAGSSPGGGHVLEQASTRFGTPPRWKSAARLQGRELAELTRRELDLGSGALGDIAALIEQNFAVDVALSPLGVEADGLCVHCGDSALILASSDFPDGHLRFTLAHELGHHLLNDPGDIIEETARDMFADNARELRANAFAGHFLMPERGIRSVLKWLDEQPGQVGERSAVALMEHFGVSMAALVYQLNVIGILSYDDGQKLRNRGVMSLIAQHRDVAPSGAAATVGRIRRAPERLTRRALAAARDQQLGLSAISSLLERDDDEQLWSEIMADRSQVVASTSIVL